MLLCIIGYKTCFLIIHTDFDLAVKKLAVQTHSNWNLGKLVKLCNRSHSSPLFHPLHHHFPSSLSGNNTFLFSHKILNYPKRVGSFKPAKMHACLFHERSPYSLNTITTHRTAIQNTHTYTQYYFLPIYSFSQLWRYTKAPEKWHFCSSFLPAATIDYASFSTSFGNPITEGCHSSSNLTPPHHPRLAACYLIFGR